MTPKVCDLVVATVPLSLASGVLGLWGLGYRYLGIGIGVWVEGFGG